MMRLDAIVFRSYPLFEKDMVIEVFTKQYGRISVFAKYAQSKKPRFGGLIHTLNYIQLQVIEYKQKFYMKQAILVNDFSNVKQDVAKMSMAYHILGLIRKITSQAQENYPIFKLLCNQLTALGELNDPSLLSFKLEFYYQMLCVEGLLSSLDKKKYSEKELIKMIESYTNQSIKESV